MDINIARHILRTAPALDFDVYQREGGICQVIVPLNHEDGDMLSIFLDHSPSGADHIRICDLGTALMRLSYTYELNTPTKNHIFESILINNQVKNDRGNLYLDTPIEQFYESILQFAGCIQKVCNMRYWERETIHSSFYDDIKTYITNSLTPFHPQANLAPLPAYPEIKVDWSLNHDHHPMFLFGVNSNNKANRTVVSLLELKKAHPPFTSFIIHNNSKDLGRTEKAFLNRNADWKYDNIDAFKLRFKNDIYRQPEPAPTQSTLPI